MLSISQITGTTSTATFLTHVPAGATFCLATSDQNTDTVWGTTSSITFATGAFIPAASNVTLMNPVTAPGFDIWVITGTGGHEVSATVISR